MLKTRPGPNSKPQPCPIVVFKLGGHRLAARAEELGGVWPWTSAIRMPSGTPLVGMLLRQGEKVLPVFDLGMRLDLRAQGAPALCLIVRHSTGPVAVQIDGEIPVLEQVDAGGLSPPTESDSGVIGSCRVGTETIAIYALSQMVGGGGGHESPRGGR